MSEQTEPTPEQQPNPAVVVVGNPIDGFYIIGPFSDADIADDWAEDRTDDIPGSWWVVTLQTPED